ncbi:hypothetical protein ACWEQL_17305 [Kitasatospora sp. NPDC004240]
MEPTNAPDAEPGDGRVRADGLGTLLHDAADLAHELLLLPSGSRTAFLEELHEFMAGLHRRSVAAVAPAAAPAEADEHEAKRRLAGLAWQLWRVLLSASGAPTGQVPTDEGDPTRVPSTVVPSSSVTPSSSATPSSEAAASVEAADGPGTGVLTEGEQDEPGPADQMEQMEQGDQADQMERPEETGPATATGNPSLDAFAARLIEIAAGYADLRDEAGGDPADVAGLWLRLHLALLKIPAEKVADRRTELAEAALLLDDLNELVEYDPDVLVPALPGVFDEAFVLPLDLPGSGEPAEADREETLSVLRDARVPEQKLQRVLPWAVRIAQARRLLAVDHTLGGYTDYSDRWSRQQATRLPQSWTAKLGSLSAVNGADTVVKSAQKLEGTLGRLCHEHPAQPGSWWWEWRSRVSALLDDPAAEAGLTAASPEDVSGWSVTYRSDRSDRNVVLHGHTSPVVLWVLTTPLLSASEPSARGRLLLGPPTTVR